MIKIFVFLAIATWLPLPVLADALITSEEAERFQSLIDPAARQVVAIDADAPSILVLQPLTEGSLKAPFPIRISFHASSGHRIAWDTLRVFYGNFQLDITERVLREANISSDSLYLPKADIPPGLHKLTVRISDERRSIAQKDLMLLVEK